MAKKRHKGNNESNNEYSNEVLEEQDAEDEIQANQSQECEIKSKWKSAKYQRCERKRRARENNDVNQTLITNYFALADQISKVINENPNEAEYILLGMEEASKEADDSDGAISFGKTSANKMSNFLQSLLEISAKNSENLKNKNYYDEAI